MPLYLPPACALLSNLEASDAESHPQHLLLAPYAISTLGLDCYKEADVEFLLQVIVWDSGLWRTLREAGIGQRGKT